MNKTYKIQLPHNKEAQNIRTNIKDGTIEVSVELNEKWEPRDGDMCFVESVDGYKSAFIFKSGAYRTSYYVSEYCICPGICDVVVSDYDIKVLRPVTNSEKQRFLAAMAKEGKRWNAEKKVVENMRWRAKAEGYYYRIDGLIGGTPDVSVCQDFRSPRSNRDYEIGNYFKTKQAAVIAGNQMLELLKKSKAE